jgi:threonine/homoserine/homoserine lactone efflux protein
VSAKVQAVVYGVVLIPVTLIAGLVLAIAGGQVRKWRNARRAS